MTEVVLAVPGMILPALLRHVTSELARIGPDDLATRYGASIWRDIEHSLGLLRIDRTTEAPGPTALVGHALFRIDEEQLLAVLLVASDPFAPERTGPDPYEALAAAHRELLDHGHGHVVLVLFHAPAETGSFFGLEAPPLGVTDVLMTPAELAVVARVEAGEPARWRSTPSRRRRSARPSECSDSASSMSSRSIASINRATTSAMTDVPR
jgi:hypothetical protein